MKDFAKPENENKHGKFAVAVALEERIVGHVPKNLINLTTSIYENSALYPRMQINWEKCKSCSRLQS